MEEKEKAFNNWRHNCIHLTFPNGNRLSTVWGSGSYSDNYDLIMDFTNDSHFTDFLDSDTCEVMVLEAPEKLLKKINKKYDADGSVIGHVTMAQWLEIVKMLSKVSKSDKKL